MSTWLYFCRVTKLKYIYIHLNCWLENRRIILTCQNPDTPEEHECGCHREGSGFTCSSINILCTPDCHRQPHCCSLLLTELLLLFFLTVPHHKNKRWAVFDKCLCLTCFLLLLVSNSWSTFVINLHHMQWMKLLSGGWIKNK